MRSSQKGDQWAEQRSPRTPRVGASLVCAVVREIYVQWSEENDMKEGVRQGPDHILVRPSLRFRCYSNCSDQSLGRL